MKHMTHTEVRNRFIDYFKKNSHTSVSSSSLIPENDPTLLFTNAGMNQFKNSFLGLEDRGYTRAVSSQKCVRAGGKHNDLENVGFTARHHTFFEMLGNFSFGDYFKKEAIHFAWEFLTKELAIPKDKLYVTVFEKDDEAAQIWHEQEGVPKERIFRFGEKDNFWRMGDTGPCGPCSEIFYDHGPKAGKISDPFKGIAAGEDRFVEIWNLVFMQYYEKSPGVLESLPKPSVDTGSGLERVTAAMQGKMNNYDTDLFMPMIDQVCQMIGWKSADLLALEMQSRENREATEFGGHSVAQLREDLAALRVLADHTRSSSFLIADGALPSNEGRGYVLRRILRRAIRYGRKLSEKHSFLPKLAEVLIETMGPIYPELVSRKKIILSTLIDEESRFLQTLDQGTQILEDEMKKMSEQKRTQISGEFLFKLYDTFGFPVDLTQLMAAEKRFTADEAGFERHMEQARQKAKASWKGKGPAADESHVIELAQQVLKAHASTQFVGYEATTGSGKVLALSTGSHAKDSLTAQDTGLLVVSSTPFYAEGGGQAGDFGSFKGPKGTGRVLNTTKQNNIYIHAVEITDGVIKTGEEVCLVVDESERRQTASNHSATHLLHAALRKTLGTHVTQAGSLVDSNRLRFDFTHNKSLSKGELESIEQMVNAEIAIASEVSAKVMKHQAAIESGALALFGEKYGDEVRVLKMGSFSTELCGGTHVTNTSQIRLFVVVSESGVSAGARRIEALTGAKAFEYLRQISKRYFSAAQFANVHTSWDELIQPGDELKIQLEKKQEESKHKEREMKKAQSGSIPIDQIVQQATGFKTKNLDAKFVFADLAIEDREVLSQIADQLKNKIATGVVIVVGQGTDSHPLIVSVTKNLNPEVSAGNLLKEISAIMGGKGGGRPDFAQGSAPDRTKIELAKTKAQQLVGL